MIKLVLEEDAPSRIAAGEVVRSPYVLLEDALSRSSGCPHIAYAFPVSCEGGEGGECAGKWRVAGVYPDPSLDDEGGWEALRLGAWYYNRGMSYGDARMMDERVSCFQAAEILYLHSAARGNVQALVNLGYVYGYDRCAGGYWPGWEAYDAGERGSCSADELAYRVLSEASCFDIAEAHYKLGDMLFAGRGCEQDYGRAFSCYQEAYRLAEHEDPVIVGSCAVRLAKCFEEGRGCRQDFQQALRYYLEAQDWLQVAVDMGEGYYRGVLRRARSGVVRMRQELSGKY